MHSVIGKFFRAMLRGASRQESRSCCARVATQSHRYCGWDAEVRRFSQNLRLELTPKMVDTGELRNQLAQWIPDAATRNRILVDNPAALYGF